MGPITPSTAMPERPLPREFYDRDTVEVARDLLGRVLTHYIGGETLAGIIVETEAYGPDDPANHAYRGLTSRNAVMFGPPGYAYVYRSYGIHWCVNAVTRSEGSGEAVLIRSLQPIAGIETMRHNRGLSGSLDDRQLCRGPGSLCKALGITGALNGAELTRPPLTIGGNPASAGVAVAVTRVGITHAAERPWRFLVAGNTYVSRPPRIAPG